jgi:hypothetical protein
MAGEHHPWLDDLSLGWLEVDDPGADADPLAVAALLRHWRNVLMNRGSDAAHNHLAMGVPPLLKASKLRSFGWRQRWPERATPGLPGLPGADRTWLLVDGKPTDDAPPALRALLDDVDDATLTHAFGDRVQVTIRRRGPPRIDWEDGEHGE